MARITIDGVARQTAEEIRAHSSAFVTLTAAFVFLPALVVGLLAPTPSLKMPVMGAMPQFPPWFWISTLATLLLQMLVTLTIASIAGDPARPPAETVGATLARMVPALLRYLGAVVLMCVGYLVVAVPALLVLVLMTGAGAALGGGASPQVSALAARQVGGVFLLFALPVLLWVGARLAPMIGVFAAERVGPTRGIGRAWVLSRGSSGILLGLLVLVIVASVLLALLGQGLGAALGSVAALGGSVALGRVVALVLASLVSAAVFVAIAAGLGVVYRQLRLASAR